MQIFKALAIAIVIQVLTQRCQLSYFGFCKSCILREDARACPRLSPKAATIAHKR
jgi:hypothetical protein